MGHPPERCDLVGGAVIETKGGRRLPVGDLLAAASAAPLPKDAPLRRAARCGSSASRPGGSTAWPRSPAKPSMASTCACPA
jgi:hypothetical protein